jgi:hypothetical protein
MFLMAATYGESNASPVPRKIGQSRATGLLPFVSFAE